MFYTAISNGAPLQHLSERRRKEIASLSRSKGRAKHQQMLVEGWRSVASALEAGAPVVDLLITPHFKQKQADHAAVISTAANRGINLFEVSEKTRGRFPLQRLTRVSLQSHKLIRRRLMIFCPIPQ